MDRKQSALLAVGTLVAALGIGAAMQYGPWSSQPRSAESQMTFNRNFESSQRKLSAYQRHLDVRLSMPKFKRERIENKKVRASLV